MATLVIHVGPGKCGSSTIQSFFSTHAAPCVEKTTFQLLSPVDIRALNQEHPSAASLDVITDILAKGRAAGDVCIVSHEFLFQNPYAVRRICSLASALGFEIIVTGYCRRQSDFMVSAYSQWLFRSAERNREVRDVLLEIDVEPLLFSGLEQQMIASVANDFHSARQLSGFNLPDWHGNYARLEHLLGDCNVVVRCGTLPGTPCVRIVVPFA